MFIRSLYFTDPVSWLDVIITSVRIDKVKPRVVKWHEHETSTANSGTETQKPTCVVQESMLVLQWNIRVANSVVWKEAKNSRSLTLGGSASHLQNVLQILIWQLT